MTVPLLAGVDKRTVGSSSVFHFLFFPDKPYFQGLREREMQIKTLKMYSHETSTVLNSVASPVSHLFTLIWLHLLMC